MLFIRIVALLFFIAAIVLLGFYFASKDRKYLNYLKKLAVYVGWCLLGIMLLFFVSRLLRLG